MSASLGKSRFRAASSEQAAVSASPTSSDRAPHAGTPKHAASLSSKKSEKAIPHRSFRWREVSVEAYPSPSRCDKSSRHLSKSPSPERPIAAPLSIGAAGDHGRACSARPFVRSVFAWSFARRSFPSLLDKSIRHSRTTLRVCRQAEKEAECPISSQRKLVAGSIRASSI